MDAANEPGAPSVGEKVMAQFKRRYQHLLDRSTIWVKTRWCVLAVLLMIYTLRVYFVNGFYIISYGLGIYLLNLLIGFLSPKMDPDTDGPVLPSAGKDGEFRPFTRRVPEFKAWHKATNATLMSTVLTFFSMFDIPVFWPILLIYFLSLTFMTLRRQIAHMIKHRYVPWSWGKTRYDRKDPLNGPGAGKSDGLSL